jgi:2-methylcitrate dehydratase PrpD
MTPITPRLVPASVLLAEPRPQWLAAWGHFAAGLRFDRLPPDLVAHTKLVLLDCIGAMAAGMQEPEMRALAARFARRGTGEAAVVGAGLRLRGDDAAFIHGTSGTALELDEGSQFARGHPGMHVLPSALATALAAGRSGADLVVAVILGYEFAARVGGACRLRPSVHPHGTWGTLGAAVAAALLDGASETQLIETLNVSATLCVGASLRAMLEGATARNSYCGLSNRNGLTAWDLVASDFTGETDAIRSVYGAVLAENFNPESLTEQLGSRFEIQRNYFKRHAACRYTHAALDVLQSLLEKDGPIAPQTVAAIEVETYASAAQLDNREPHNMLAARFSVPFAIATMLVNGEASVPAFRRQAVDNVAIRELTRRVSVRERVEFTAMLPDKRPARVTLRMTDGRVLSGETLTNRGDAANPYTPDEVRAKFLELVTPIWGAAHADRLLATIETIDAAPNLTACNNLLAEPPQ